VRAGLLKEAQSAKNDALDYKLQALQWDSDTTSFEAQLVSFIESLKAFETKIQQPSRPTLQNVKDAARFCEEQWKRIDHPSAAGEKNMLKIPVQNIFKQLQSLEQRRKARAATEIQRVFRGKQARKKFGARETGAQE